MNDLPDAIKIFSVESYVDDTKLFLSFATNDNVNALSQIGQDLNRVAEWCCTNRLLINPQKSEVHAFWNKTVGWKIEWYYYLLPW